MSNLLLNEMHCLADALSEDPKYSEAAECLSDVSRYIAELESREVTDDLKSAHMMIVCLCRVARVAGRHEIAEKAIDLIRRQGYNPPPLREGEKLKPSAALQEGKQDG